MATIMILAVLIIGVLFLLLPRFSSGNRPRGKEKTVKRSAPSVQRNPYNAVSVMSSRVACTAVGKIKNQKFLSKDAPLLPLAACSVKECNCKYVHHPDRRDESNDRRMPYSLGTTFYAQGDRPDRRANPGRRSSDYSEVDTSSDYSELDDLETARV